MKKILAVLLALALVVPFASCDKTNDENTGDDTNVVDTNKENEEENNEENNEDASNNEEEVKVMTYAEYAAAELETEVVIEAYVQAKQSWWDNKATVYTQNEDGAFFIYEMACTEEDYAKLEKGTKIRVTGHKGAWAGEVEIMDGTFEILEGSYIAEAMDATALLGTEELINHQNKFVTFKGMTVESVSYKNDEPGDDIYVTLSKDGTSYDFCVEIYLTGEDTEVYKTVGTLEAGDVVDVEGFLYWYEGVNPHITAVTVAE